MNKKISEKDKRDWQNFISNNKKLSNKDINLEKNKNKKKIENIIDLHGFSIKIANQVIEELIIECFEKDVNIITVITGKGLRSKNKENPYVSKDLSILKYSVPDYIKSNQYLMKIIKKIEGASIKDGGQGAFYIYLKNR